MPASAAVALLIATALPALAAAPEAKPVAGQQVRFPQGIWSGVPQAGPDGKVAMRAGGAAPAHGQNGPVNTHFAINISHGTGFVFMIQDEGLAIERVLDDQAEIVLGERSFPAVTFQIAGDAFIFHPGDAAAALEALGKARQVRLHSDGSGVDSGYRHQPAGGSAELAESLRQDVRYRHRQGQRSRRAADARSTAPLAANAGDAGDQSRAARHGGQAEDRRLGCLGAAQQQGQILVCFIRRHYYAGSEPGARHLATFFMVSRAKGLTMMLKDSNLHLTEGDAVEATLKFDDRSFTGFSAQVKVPTRSAFFRSTAPHSPWALENGGRGLMKSPVSDNFEFPVQASVIPWLRACARRNGIPIEPVSQ